MNLLLLFILESPKLFFLSIQINRNNYISKWYLQSKSNQIVLKSQSNLSLNAIKQALMASNNQTKIRAIGIKYKSQENVISLEFFYCIGNSLGIFLT